MNARKWVAYNGRHANVYLMSVDGGDGTHARTTRSRTAASKWDDHNRCATFCDHFSPVDGLVFRPALEKQDER